MKKNNYFDDVYILGAGTSAHSGAPLGKHFLKLVFSYSKKDRRINNIRYFLEKYFNITDKFELFPKFEEVLSFIDIAIKREETLTEDFQTKEILELKTDLNYLIWKALEFVKNDSKQNEHKDFIDKKITINSAIISLNYDTLIDSAFEEKNYVIDYGIDFENRKINTLSNKTIKVFKLHGSLNWLYCPGCYSIYHYNGNEIKKIFAPVPELCKNDNIYLKGIIIPPTYIKEYSNPFINIVWLQAVKVLSLAKKIHFIGSSFSDADLWFKFLVKKAIYQNKFNPEIIVINPEKRGTVKNRYERILGKVNYIQSTFSNWIKM